jgi:hypothetical protein
MLMPCSTIRLVTPDCSRARPALLNGFTWRRHLIILLVGVLSALMVACSSVGSEPVGAISTRSEDAAAPRVNNPTEPNIAILTWDAVSHPSLRGYRVYYSPKSFEYFQHLGKVVDVGNATAHTIKGLASGRRYYFAVTAYDVDGEESDSSNVVFKDIP